MASNSKPRKFLGPFDILPGEQNLLALQCQYRVTLANCNKASIKKSSARHNLRERSLFRAHLYLLKHVSRGPSGLSGGPGPL